MVPRCLTIWFAAGLIVSQAAMAGIRGASSPVASPAFDAWTEAIPASAFKAVVPTDAELNAFSRGGPNIHGVSGPYDDVLAAWNSVSFDGERGLICAHGGGHGDCGGNEVYRVEVRRSVLRQSPNSDGRDLIAIAVAGCQLPPATLVLEDTRWTATKLPGTLPDDQAERRYRVSGGE